MLVITPEGREALPRGSLGLLRGVGFARRDIRGEAVPKAARDVNDDFAVLEAISLGVQTEEDLKRLPTGSLRARGFHNRPQDIRSSLRRLFEEGFIEEEF